MKELELKVIGDSPIAQLSAMQGGKEPQMKVVKKRLPQPSSHGMAEPVLECTWPGCDTSGESTACVWFSVCLQIYCIYAG